MSVLKKVVDFLSSFGLAVAILAFMFVLTFLGTIVQDTVMTLHDAQKMYFESWYVIQPVGGGVNVPLPGGITLMAALSLNLLLGGIVRMRYTLSRAGILITHFGIAFLMIAGLVKFAASDEGQMLLYPGESSTEYRDPFQLELVIFEPRASGLVREFTVPAGDLASLRPGQRVTVRHPDIPFELDLHDYAPNARIQPKGPMFEVAVPVVEGYFLQPMRTATRSNQINFPGCYATARVDGHEPQVGILWNYEVPPELTAQPWTVTANGKQWGVKLRCLIRPVPFEVRVDDFEAEFHPRSPVAKSYASDVTVFDGDEETTRRIEMNKPLRRDGFILFQSSYGPQNGPPDREFYTVFSVVRNPSDQWPMWACWIIGFGLTVHFGFMLKRYIGKERAALRKAQS